MIEIQPHKNIDIALEVPGSKSITQRALIAAALADGESCLLNPLASEDTRYTSAALRQLGVEVREQGDRWLIRGNHGRIQTPEAEIFLGNNGTATRFLTSVAALGRGVFRISGEARMEERPILPLIQALNGWGVAIESIKGTGCPPLEIRADGIKGGHTLLPAGQSSQYLSSLLLVAPYAENEAQLKVEGEVVSRPYVRMTLAVMHAFDIEARANEQLNEFSIPGGCYRAREYAVEGDASSASYFWGAAAVTGGRVTVSNVPKNSLQGDAHLVNILEKMGCLVQYAQGITVTGPKILQGVEVDMGDCPDVAPTLAVVASRALGRTVIKNVAHLRIKECDRLHAVATELGKMGVEVQQKPDALIIEGRGPEGRGMHGAEIETYRDHRIAMSFAVAGLVVPGVKIRNETCVSKSFPDFWQRFQKLYT